MSASFDPYVEWLGIADARRPPNLYRLINVQPFEQDPQVILLACDAMLSRVRAVRPGQHLSQWQQLLDELSTAKSTLTNTLRKEQYDKTLRESDGGGAKTSASPFASDPNLFPPTMAPRAGAPTPAAKPSPSTTTLPTGAPAKPSTAPFSPFSVAPASPLPATPAPGYPQAQMPQSSAPTPNFAPVDPMAPMTGYAQPASPYSQTPTYPQAPQAPAYRRRPVISPRRATDRRRTLAQPPTYPQAPAGGYQQPSMYPQAGAPVYPQAPAVGYPQAAPAYPQAGYPQAGYPQAPAQGVSMPPLGSSPPSGLPVGGAFTPYAAPIAPSNFAMPPLGAPVGSPAVGLPVGVAPAGVAPSAAPLGVPVSQPSFAMPPTAAPKPIETVSMPSLAPKPSGFAETVEFQPLNKPAGQESAADRMSPQPIRLELAAAPAAIATGVSPSYTPRAAVARQSRASRLPVLVGAVGSLALIGIIAFTIFNRPPSEPQVAQNDPAANAIAPPVTDEAKAVKPKPTKPNDPPRQDPAPENPPAETATDTPASVEPEPTPTEEPEPVAKPKGKSKGKAKPTPKEDPDPEMTPDVKPEVKPTPEPAPAMDPEKTAAFNKAIKSARASLSDRKLDAAKQQIETAKAAATTADQQLLAERMRLLHGYTEQFWQAVKKTLTDLQGTDELTIGSTTVAVVSSDPEELTVHLAGANKTYKLNDMSAALLTVLAARWFDPKSPTTKICLGAFHAADSKGDIKEARRLWDEAAKAGAPTDDLKPLLDLGATPVLAADLGPIPEQGDLDAAKETVRTTFEQDLKAAKTPQKKADLSKKFVDLALTTEEAPDRYVLFEQGIELASAGGSIPGIMRAVDEMAKWYKVDALQLKTEALTKANTSSNTLVAKAVARSALELLDEAINAKRPDEARSLAKTAANAARKAKDGALVKEAAAGEQKAKDL